MDANDKRLNILFYFGSLFFIAYTIWWFVLNLYFSPENNLNNYFTDSYGIVAGIGGIVGILVANKWGGLKSIFGIALLMISIGLFFQFLGQISYAIYYYVYHIDNPYPSFGELFYFGSIPVYIYGVWLLGHAVGAKLTLQNVFKNPMPLSVPIVMIYFAYRTFLIDYSFDLSAPITSFLDIGYPVGQAIFVSLAVLVVINSKGILGGVMKKYVLFVLYAFIFQYFADTAFLYHTYAETWRAGGFDDFLYLVSYFWMTLSLFRFSEAANLLSNSSLKKTESNKYG